MPFQRKVAVLEAQSLETEKGLSPTMPDLMSAALNSSKRSMSHPEAYPFVLSPSAIDKLGFVHQLAHSPAWHQP